MNSRHSIPFVALLLSLLITRFTPAIASPQGGAILWHADNGQNQSLLWGPHLYWKTAPDLITEAHILHGTFNQGGDIERYREYQLLFSQVYPTFDAGFGYRYLDHRNRLQRGFVWSYPEEKDERNADIHGPLIRLSTQTGPGWAGLALYARAAWMPYDFGDFDDLGYDATHWEIDAGLTYSRRNLTASAGYLYRKFRNLPDRIVNDRTFSRDTMDGILLTLRFQF
ncbi:MAG TPA: hypothetical protein PKE55_07725 [Kiritimatiellia bacterium]|nr:hypothetical protein [Kiritimatiellia bacterium]